MNVYCLALHLFSSLLPQIVNGTDTILKTPDVGGMTYSGLTYAYHMMGQKKGKQEKNNFKN